MRTLPRVIDRTDASRRAAALAAALSFPLLAASPAAAQAPAGKTVPQAQIAGDGFSPPRAASDPAPARKRTGKQVRAVGDGFVSATGSQRLRGGGVGFFVNDNITFSTTSSASGAMSEASMTAARTDVSTADGGVTAATLNDAFDGYGSLSVHVGADASDAQPRTGDPAFTFYGRNGPSTLTCEDREVRLAEQSVGDLTMSRRVYVPAGAPVGRWLEVLRNDGAAPLTVTAYLTHNLGSDNNTSIFATSGGDLAPDVDDGWVGTFQNFSGTTSNDPRLGHVLQGRGARAVRAASFADGDDNPYWSYELTLDPGETQIIATYAVVEATKTLAATRAAALADRPLTDCMTDEERAQLANFDVTAPRLTLPPTRTVAATSVSGAVVDFAATAADDRDGAIPVTCTPASGSVFPVGTTRVTCTARDAAGNVTTDGFDVVVGAWTPPVVPPPPVTPPVTRPPVVDSPLLLPRMAKPVIGPRCVTPVGGKLSRLVASYRLAAPAQVTYRIQTRKLKQPWTSCPTPRDPSAAPPPPRSWRTLLAVRRSERAGRRFVAFDRRPAERALARTAQEVPVLGWVGLSAGSYRLVITARNAAGTKRMVRNFVVLPPRG